MKKENTQKQLPVKLAKPAQRALQGAGITTLKQVSGISEQEISKLHGIGKNAILEIKKVLIKNGLSFAQKKK
jgi:DNA-directed RNA polymerase alpha subunit